MSDKGTPFFPGEYKRWNFAEFHPNIEKLELRVVHHHGRLGKVGQERIEKIYSEKNMPEKLYCEAGCTDGGLDLSTYLKNLEYQKETEHDNIHILCKGSFGRSAKGRRRGEPCSHSQFEVHAKITYKSKT